LRDTRQIYEKKWVAGTTLGTKELPGARRGKCISLSEVKEIVRRM
jgi:hypothetical protein